MLPPTVSDINFCSGRLNESGKLDSLMLEVRPTPKRLAEFLRVMSSVVPVANKDADFA